MNEGADGPGNRPHRNDGALFGIRVSGRSLERASLGSSIPLARRAWDLGIRVFELGAPGNLVGTGYALGRTIPELTTEGSVLLDLSDSTSLPSLAGDESNTRPSGALEDLLATVSSALGGARVERVELGAGWSEEPEHGRMSPLPRPVTVVGWIGDDVPAETLEQLRRGGIREFNVPHNLLAPLPPGVRSELLRDPGPALFVRDALAGGKLLGLEPKSIRSDGPRPPVPIRELERYWAPVTRLGFLSKGGSRTLAQAAIQFIIQTLPGTTILLDVDGPERLEEILAARTRPPLSEQELGRIWDPADTSR